MAKRSNAAYKDTLRSYAVGISQDVRSANAEFLAPTVPVGGTQGKFKKYADSNAFQVYHTERAMGGDARRIQFDDSDADYNCKPQALEITIDIAEREAAGDAQDVLEQGKTKTLLQSAALSHEHKVFTLARNTVAAINGKGVWSSDDIDPIVELDEQIEAIANATGLLPNRMLLPIGIWRVVKNHVKVLERCKAVGGPGISMEKFAAELLNPAIEIRLATLIGNVSIAGAAKTKKNLAGGDVWLFYSSPNPTPFDASFLKTFRGGFGGIDQVYVYEEGPRKDVLAVDWSEDVQVASPICGKRITIS